MLGPECVPLLAGVEVAHRDARRRCRGMPGRARARGGRRPERGSPRSPRPWRRGRSRRGGSGRRRSRIRSSSPAAQRRSASASASGRLHARSGSGVAPPSGSGASRRAIGAVSPGATSPVRRCSSSSLSMTTVDARSRRSGGAGSGGLTAAVITSRRGRTPRRGRPRARARWRGRPRARGCAPRRRTRAPCWPCGRRRSSGRSRGRTPRLCSSAAFRPIAAGSIRLTGEPCFGDQSGEEVGSCGRARLCHGSRRADSGSDPGATPARILEVHACTAWRSAATTDRAQPSICGCRVRLRVSLPITQSSVGRP